MKIGFQRRQRSGLTAIEIVLALSVIGIATGIMVPSYRNYIIRSDLELARQSIAQAIERAKFLSQVSMNDSSWGFTTQAAENDPNVSGVLFMGASYADANNDYDEYYPIPETIAASGIEEIVFEKITGTPSETGVMTLTTISGEQRQITISVGDDGSVSVPEDWLVICARANTGSAATINVPDSLWEYYEQQGAELGTCSSGGDTGDGGDTGGGGDPIELDEPELEDGGILPEEDYTCTITVLGAAIESNGDPIPVTVDANFDNGSTPGNIFGDADLPVTANVNDGEEHEFECDSFSGGDYFTLEARSWEKKSNWYSGTQNSHWRTYLTVNQYSNVYPNNTIILRDGDDVPANVGAYNQGSVEDFIEEYIDYSGDDPVMDLGPGELIILFELGTTSQGNSAFDMQDLVVLISLYEV